MKWKKNAVSRQHNISERRVLFSFFLCSLSCAVIFYIYCVRTAKLFRRGWMSRWAARWLAAGIAIYAHQMKREMTSNIFSSILYRCWGIDGGFSAVCIISPHSSELDDEPTSFFLFSVPFLYPPSPFSLSLYDIVLPSIDICIRCSLHVSWWWRRRRGFVLDDYIGPSIFFFFIYNGYAIRTVPSAYIRYLIDTLLLCKSQKEKKILLRDRNRRIFRSNIRASKLPIYRAYPKM